MPTTVDWPRTQRGRQLAPLTKVVLLAAVYYAAARLGLVLQLPGTNASPVWPPAGIGLAAMLLFGPRIWPGIALGALLGNLTTLPASGAGLLASAGICLGSTLEHLVAYELVRRFVGPADPFDRAASVFHLVAITGCACLVASSFGAASLWLTGIVPTEALRAVWTTWWLGDATGMLIITPALYCWWRKPRLGLSRLRAAELATLLFLTAAVAEALFGGWIAAEIIDSLPYLVAPGLLWAAFRFGPRETATTAVLISAIAIAHTWVFMNRVGAATSGRDVYAPFVNPELSATDSLLMLQLFAATVAVLAMTLAAAVRQQRIAEERSRQLAAIVESSADAIISTDLDDVVTSWNRGAQRLYGFSADEMIGRPITGLLAADGSTDHNPAPDARSDESVHIRSDGTRLDVSLTTSPIENSAGHTVGTATIARDITERNRAAEALRERDILISSVLNSTAEGIYGLTLDGECTFANQASARLLGYDSPDELLGNNMHRLIHHTRPDGTPYPEEECRIARVSGHRNAVHVEDEVLWRRDGSSFAAEYWSYPVERDGRVVGSVVTFLDITERRRMQAVTQQVNEELERRVSARTADLARSNAALEQSNVELQQFAYAASHDLQTPLRGIANFAQLLQTDYRGRLDPTADDYIQRIIKGTTRMRQLISDLLEYSRTESRAAPFQPVDLNEVVDDVISLLQPSIEDADGEVSRDQLPTVSGDRAQLCQLLQNLIGNGIKYHSDEPPRVHVSAERRASGWEIVVADNGIGIKPKYHERIFEIFRRLHTQDAYPGTGVGLAVCRRIATRHRGRIWVDSQLGRGSRFRIAIPEQATNVHRVGTAETPSVVESVGG